MRRSATQETQAISWQRPLFLGMGVVLVIAFAFLTQFI
jgi:hypothetical protein